MGGQQSSQAKEQTTPQVASQATEQTTPQVEAQVEAKKEEVKVVQEPAKAAATVEATKPDAGAKASPKSAPKASPKDKAASPKNKAQGPPQQPGLVTNDSKKKGDKGTTKGAGEKGAVKGAGKKGKAEAQGVQLCVRNLARVCSPAQLRDLFSPFGELTSVDVKNNPDGTSRGFGFVTYSTMEAATKAIAEMNGKAMSGSKNLVVVLSDRQQGIQREGKGDGKSKGEGGKAAGGKGKEGKADAGKGKGKGKAPASITTSGLPAPAGWPSPYSSQNMEQLYSAYGYGHPMMSPMAAYASQGNYPQSPSNVQALQAQFLQAQAQAMQAQAQAFYSGLGGSSVVPGAAAISAAGVSAQPPPPPSAPASDKPKPVQPAAGTEYEGALKSISAKNGYGFLTCAETKAAYGRDVFVDASLVPEGIQVGDKVLFSCALSEKGHPRATMVKLQQVAAR